MDHRLEHLSGGDDRPGERDADADDPFSDSKKIVALFAQDPSTKQVAPDKVQKNPFELLLDRSRTPVVKPAADPSEKEHLARISKLRAELNKLTLQSVLQGPEPMAIISTRVVRIGDRIGPFTVAEIRRSAAVLTAENNSWTLTMESPDASVEATGKR